MKNEYSEHQTDQLLCIFLNDFSYSSRHIETDAILLHVCGFVRGGCGQGPDWHA